MHLTHPARDAHCAASVLMLAALGVAMATQARDSGTLLLDLTKPVPREEDLNVLPGASIGGIGGQPLPRGYPLPLAAQLQSISPQPVRPGEKFTVEVLLRNTGDSAFYLPASQNSVKVLMQGNKGRRRFLFFLIFEDSPMGRQTSSVVAGSEASDTVPSSWLRVEPGQSVRVLFRGDLYPIRDWLKADLKQVRVRAQVSEWKFEDKRYFIENEAEPVASGNTVVVDLAPAS